jgi:hypothetical protein
MRAHTLLFGLSYETVDATTDALPAKMPTLPAPETRVFPIPYSQFPLVPLTASTPTWQTDYRESAWEGTYLGE